MSSEQKTLIVFDTSKLRATIRGGPSYGSFEFSKEFKELQSSIVQKGLSNYIDIGVSRLVLEELQNQKIEQYTEDIKNISDIRIRLSELPGVDFTLLRLPDTTFDCQKHLNPLLKNFIWDNRIIIIDTPDDKSGYLFKEIIKRAVEKTPPFRKGKSDAGFKDTVSWMSLLNYENLDNYDKVIFVSKDSDFNEKCKFEFEEKIKKHICISTSVNFVISEIEEDYKHFIEKKEVIDFANTDYFKDHISKFLFELDKIPIESNEYTLEKTRVVNYSESIEDLEEDETDIATIIVSSVKGTVKIDNIEKDMAIRVKTYLDDTKGILDTDFEVDKNGESKLQGN